MKKIVVTILMTAFVVNFSFADNTPVFRDKPIDRLFLSARIITGSDLQKQKEAFVRSVGRTNNYTDYLPLTAGSDYPLSGTLFSSMGSNSLLFAATTTTTGYKYVNIQNTGGSLVFGVDNSSGTGLSYATAAAYATVFGSANNTPVEFISNNSVRYTIDGSGNNTWTGNGTFGGAITSGGTITSTMGNNAVILNSTSATTGYQYINIANTSGWLNAGVESSAGNTIFYGSLPYSTVLGNGSNRSLHLATNNTVRYTIDGSGNVGIGTTSPSALLHLFATSSGSDLVSRIEDNGINYTAAVYNSYKTLTHEYLVGAGGNNNSLNPNTFFVYDLTNSVDRLSINASGNVGIGTTTPSEKLSVYGNIRSEKMIVAQSGWPDYVFNPSFKLKSLLEVEQFIKANNHLPGVPSAKDVEKGVDLGATEAILLKKMEEMTLYMIDMSKKIEKIESENKLLKKQFRTSK